MEFVPTFSWFNPKIAENVNFWWKKRGEYKASWKQIRMFIFSLLLPVDWRMHWKWDFNAIQGNPCSGLHLTSPAHSDWMETIFSFNKRFFWQLPGSKRFAQNWLYPAPIFWASDAQSDWRWEYLHSVSLSRNVIPAAAFFSISKEWIFQLRVPLPWIYANPMAPSRYDPVFV